MHLYFTYMLLCSDGTYYVGVTNNMVRRFAEHCEGADPRSYTAKRRPLKLVYVENFQWIQDAIAREKQLKGWSVPKKEALMMNDDAALHELSKCRNTSRHRRPEGTENK